MSGTRVGPLGADPPLADTVAAIAPRFTVIAHDPADPVFGRGHAEALFAWAGEPKQLWWVPGGGPGRSMLTLELAARVRGAITEQLGSTAS